MNERFQDLLRDVTRYLEQRRAAGLEAIDLDATGLEAVPTAESAVAPTAAADPRPAVRAERERRFQAECDRFLQDSLALIARMRAAALEPPAAAPVQGAMFASGPRPEPSPAALPAEPSPPDDPAAALATIAAEVRGCTRCALHAGRTLAVPGAGDPRAGLVLIGEAPGQEEDRQGLPFVGRSGQLLTDILRAIGFTRDEVFICNILKCRPPDNRDPEREEAAACVPYLERQLAAIGPRLIICLGRVAAQRLLGTDASLTALRRSLHFYREVPVLATFHPAALLRNPAQKREAWEDVRKARALYDALAPRATDPA